MLHMSGNTHIKLTAVFTEHSNLEGVITPFSTSTAWEISNIFSFPLMVFVNSPEQKHSSRMRHKMHKQWLKTYQDNNAKHNLFMSYCLKSILERIVFFSVCLLAIIYQRYQKYLNHPYKVKKTFGFHKTTMLTLFLFWESFVY